MWGQPIRSVKAGHPQYVTVFRNRNAKVHLKTGRIIDEAALPMEAVSYMDSRSCEAIRGKDENFSGHSFNVSAGPPSK